MSSNSSPEARRAERRDLRIVSRLLRWSGTVLALIGAIGLIVSDADAWWTGPSWFSLIVGMLLALAGIVSRVRDRRKPPPGTAG
jgi:protein-S-isoprenylcysteine O-methyltransferase Ste14